MVLLFRRLFGAVSVIHFLSAARLAFTPSSRIYRLAEGVRFWIEGVRFWIDCELRQVCGGVVHKFQVFGHPRIDNKITKTPLAIQRGKNEVDF